ncbi:MAG: hypothetical protein IPL95_18245 [Saprospiraceae bacterium]|nr:hypothetical protein [Saprospiraceae bacterium]
MCFQIIRSISLFFFLIQVASCQKKDSKSVAEILIVTPVNTNFVSSDEHSDLNIDGKKYWTHYKIKYSNDTLIEFKKYLSEGPIEYSIVELKADTAIYKSLNVPLKHSWRIYNNELYDNNSKSEVEIVKLDEIHYKEYEGRRIFIVK